LSGEDFRYNESTNTYTCRRGKALTRTGRINGRDFGECGCASRCRRSDDCRPSRPVGRTGPTTLATVEIVRYRAGPALGTAPDSDGSSDARRTSAARRHLLLLIRRGRRNGQEAQEASQYQQPGVSQRLAQLVEIDQPEIEQRTEQYETGRIIARPSSSQITIKKA
jgi:hypothetical protein